MSNEQNSVIRGMRMAVRNDSTAFAYSVLITCTFGVVSFRHEATTARIFLFAVGATCTFALAEAASSRLFRMRLREEQSEIVVVGTAMAPLSVTASLGAAVLLSSLVGPLVAWATTPVAATSVYLLFTGAQLTLARRFAEQHPPDSSDE